MYHDYLTETLVTPSRSGRSLFQKVEVVFGAPEGALLGYSRTHLLKEEEDVARILDITSASGYRHMSPYMQEWYQKNGYDPSIIPSGFGKNILAYTIDAIREINNRVNFVLVSAYQRNEAALSNVVSSYAKEHNKRILGGGEEVAVTLFL